MFVSARCRDAVDPVKFPAVVIKQQSLPDRSWQDALREVQAVTGSPALVVTSRLAED